MLNIAVKHCSQTLQLSMLCIYTANTALCDMHYASSCTKTTSTPHSNPHLACQCPPTPPYPDSMEARSQSPPPWHAETVSTPANGGGFGIEKQRAVCETGMHANHITQGTQNIHAHAPLDAFWL